MDAPANAVSVYVHTRARRILGVDPQFQGGLQAPEVSAPLRALVSLALHVCKGAERSGLTPPARNFCRPADSGPCHDSEGYKFAVTVNFNQLEFTHMRTERFPAQMSGSSEHG